MWAAFTKTAVVVKSMYCAFLCSILFAACSGPVSNRPTPYRPTFASDTTENKALIFGFPSFTYGEAAAPLATYLNKNLQGVQVKIKACTTFEEYLELLKKKEIDVTLINGIVALAVADSGYSIHAKIADDEAYSSVIFVRKNAHINEVGDLKGRSIALMPDRNVIGSMMALYYLYEKGLDVNRYVKRVPVPSFESSIITTYMGQTEAGACLKRNWTVYTNTHPEMLMKIELKWETPPLVNSALVIRSSIDPRLITQLRDLLLSIQTTAEGQAALKPLNISGFENADNNTYRPLMEFKKKYDAKIL